MSDNKAEAERLASISDGGYWNVIEDRFVTTQEEIQKSLENAQKAGRDDHSEDKLDMVNKLAAERAKVDGLLETIKSQKQTHGALLKKCRELEAQNAVMREALEKIATTAFQQYDGNKPFVSEHDSGYSLGIADGHRLAAKWAYEAIRALPLPSEVTK